MAYIKKSIVLPPFVIFLAVYSLVYQVQANECYSDSDCSYSRPYCCVRKYPEDYVCGPNCLHESCYHDLNCAPSECCDFDSRCKSGNCYGSHSTIYDARSSTNTRRHEYCNNDSDCAPRKCCEFHSRCKSGNCYGRTPWPTVPVDATSHSTIYDATSSTNTSRHTSQKGLAGWIIAVIAVCSVIVIPVAVVACCCCQPAHGGVVVAPSAAVGSTILATKKQQNYPPPGRPGQPMHSQNSQPYPNDLPQSCSLNEPPLAHQPTATDVVHPQEPMDTNTVKY